MELCEVYCTYIGSCVSRGFLVFIISPRPSPSSPYSLLYPPAQSCSHPCVRPRPHERLVVLRTPTGRETTHEGTAPPLCERVPSLARACQEAGSPHCYRDRLQTDVSINHGKSYRGSREFSRSFTLFPSVVIIDGGVTERIPTTTSSTIADDDLAAGTK